MNEWTPQSRNAFLLDPDAVCSPGGPEQPELVFWVRSVYHAAAEMSWSPLPLQG